MKRWWVFYITVLIAICINCYIGVYKELWVYAEQINLFGIIVLIGVNQVEIRKDEAFKAVFDLPFQRDLLKNGGTIRLRT